MTGNPAASRKLLLIGGLVLIWGVSWPIYKVALAYTPPVLFAGMRTLLGGVVLVVFALLIRDRLLLRANWRLYLLGALFNVAIFYGAQTVGLTDLPEGVFSVIVYIEPVLVGVGAWVWLGEGMSLSRFFGLLAGVAGVAAVSWGSLAPSSSVSATGVVLALVTALSWTAGTLVVKGARETPDLLWLAAGQTFLGGVALTAGGLASERWSAIVWTPTYWVGLLWGGFFGIALAWVLFFRLLASGEATQAASFTYLVPAIAVTGGVVFLGEHLTWGLFAGVILIAVGVGLVNRPQEPARGRSATS